MRLVIHLWNGTWGRLAKRDIRAYVDGGQVVVERTEHEQVVERIRCSDPATAIAVARGMVEQDGGRGWRDVTATPRPAAQ